ncbi:MAG: hypothetical protein EBR91_09545 [Flavobacteriia bacterium]|nr:hypothetical protein [Flavobacteriia bacterium]
MAFTVNVLADVEPSVALLVTESKPLIVALVPTSTEPLTVTCCAVTPAATNEPDNVVPPLTRILFVFIPLLNVGVAFTVNVLAAVVPSTVLLLAVNIPLIVAPDPTSTVPLTVTCEVVKPLLNIGLAFTVNVLLDEVPSTVLLVTESNPLIVSFNPTSTEPLTVICATVTLAADNEPDNVVAPVITRLFDVNPLLNVGVAFTVKLLADVEPIVALLVTESKPLIVEPKPTSKEPLTVTCAAVIPVATNEPDNVVEPLTKILFVLIPLLNVGVAFTVNVLFADVPITVLLLDDNTPLIVAPAPTSTVPLTVTCDAVIPVTATNEPDNVVAPFTFNVEVVIPLLNVGVAFTVNVLLPDAPITVLLLVENTPLIVAFDPTNKLPLTVTCEAVIPDTAVTKPDNVVAPFTFICDVVKPLLNVGVAFTVNVLFALVPITVLLLAESKPLIVEPNPTSKFPLIVTLDDVVIPLTFNDPALIVPVVVILLDPVLIEPNPLVIEPLFNAPTVAKLGIEVIEFCVAVLIVPSILALIVPTGPVKIEPKESTASGMKVNF